MSTKLSWVRFAILLMTLLLAGLIPIHAGRAQSQPAAGSPPANATTEQAYKNIQVLKAIPANQLIPAMQFITASLGG
jgi:hypothetical protein